MMPVKIKLAKKGKMRTEESPSNTLLVSLVKRLLEPGDVVVEQLEIVVISFSPPTEGIRTTTCAPVSRAMELGVFKSKYGSTMIIFTPSRFICPINSTVC